MPNVGGKDISTNEAAVVGAGIVLFIFSFFHWFTVTIGGGFGTYHGSAWHTGFLSWAGVLIAFAGAGLIALERFSPVTLPSLPVPASLIVLGLAVVGALFILLKMLIGYHSTDRGLGIYVGLIAVIVEAVFAFLAFTASGGKLSDYKPGSTTPPPAGA